MSVFMVEKKSPLGKIEVTTPFIKPNRTHYFLLLDFLSHVRWHRCVCCDGLASVWPRLGLVKGWSCLWDAYLIRKVPDQNDASIQDR